MGQFHEKDAIENKLIKQLEWDISGAVDSVTETGFFKHVASSSCDWCDYSSICKSKEKLLKPLELDTKHKVIPIKLV